MKMRKHKYNAKRTKYNGRTYDSKAEAEYAMNLDWKLKAGDIHYWTPQVRFQLGPDFETRVDFMVCIVDKSDGQQYWEAHEVKGRETPQFKRVRKLWDKYVPMTLVIAKKKNSGWQVERI